MDLFAFTPACLTTALYWVWWYPAEEPCLPALVLKTLPTLNLAAALHLQPPSNSRRQKLTMCGLLASAVGDAALVYPSGFLLGMAGFAIAHLFYILSLPPTTLLGRRPAFGFFSAATLLALAAAIWHHFLRAGLTDPVLAVGVPIYIIWLTSTVWRAAVAEQWLMFLGAAIFMVSDCLIGINLFYTPVPNSQEWIMGTYHVAQYLITIAALLSTDRVRDKVE